MKIKTLFLFFDNYNSWKTSLKNRINTCSLREDYRSTPPISLGDISQDPTISASPSWKILPLFPFLAWALCNYQHIAQYWLTSVKQRFSTSVNIEKQPSLGGQFFHCVLSCKGNVLTKSVHWRPVSNKQSKVYHHVVASTFHQHLFSLWPNPEFSFSESCVLLTHKHHCG